MGMRPVMVSIPNDGKVWNMPRIQMAARHCIWLRTLSRYDKGVLL